MNILDGLNPQQKQAVTASNGPVLVLAGPGSGKTRVLTQRIVYLIGQTGVSPYHLLAVTFTNKAAREMERRVTDILGETSRGLTLGTFHSTCARILRREAEHLPFDNNFVIFDADDQLSLVKRALEEENLDEKRFRATGVLASISNAKNELVLPEHYPLSNYRDEIVRRVYKTYQKLLLANNGLDFDDLLLWTANLLEQNPKVREKYARRYEHVLVDEFQDTNMAQYVLLKHLASFHGNIFVVGDTDQSIYRWRGADYRNVLRFEEDYPATQIILLEQNYRSTQAILDVAMAVIDRNPYRKKKLLFTERGQGLKVVVNELYNDQAEASFIVDTIASQVKRGGARPSDFAVMYRTNAQSRVLEEAFIAAGLPHKLVGAQRFYGRREIKDLVAYLRVVHNPNDEVSLGRIINVPGRGIGDKTWLALRTEALRVEQPVGQLLLSMAQNSKSPVLETFKGRAGSALGGFSRLLAIWSEQKENLPPLGLLDRILMDVEYQGYIDDGTEEGHDRWENVMELRRLAAEFQEQTLADFLERVALVSDQDTLENGANKATLLTLHAAKGLEYPVVFIFGLNDGVLPHSRSFDDPEEMMEERRLLYVGITRAMNRLYLTYAQHRSAYGYSESAEPSRFLDDVPYALIEETGPSRRSVNGAEDEVVQRFTLPAKPERWTPQRSAAGSPGASKAAQPDQPRYRAGMRVIHPTWGEGMVLNSKHQDDDEVLDIYFQVVGLKRLAASLAPLKIKGEN